ncbi:MAG: FAD-binding oxidoreductase [Eubacterium aggregans]|uniref:Glycolate oxidase n=1 Tax=Eubacterium aggregans TaxID=81409 RepID=A0A1H3Z4G3_9FIRM|nr:FAD-binding oxidoreductase [Eubacterium aggregans]MEA5073946.1 FAD-binding oxidoreductase [Eubacterium aggregans]SEA18587.1 glycolate oxidase [Eubacterium aggregans]
MSITYNPVTPEIIEAIQAAAPGHVLVGDAINEDFCHDEMSIYGKAMPDVVVEATTTEEVAAVMTICNENKIPVTPSGARTALTGGPVSLLGGVMISTTKMNKILGYDQENFVVRIQPGVLLNDLAEDCIKQGLMYPPDPGEKFATVGGNVSTNAGGMRAVKYGTTRDYVRAMTVVLPTGEVVTEGATVSKTSSGFSLLNLMIGSEGTLGIITELTLKVIPQPKSTISMIIPYETLEEAIATVPKFFLNHLSPQALEFMERDVVDDTEKFLGKQVYPKQMEGMEIGAYVLATFDGSDEDELMDIVEAASEIVLESGAIDVLVADTPQLMRDAWAVRSALLEAIEANTTLLDECDVVVPVNKIPEFLTYAKSLQDEHGFTIKSFGHAGDGNLHVYTCSNDMEEGKFKEEAAKFMKQVYAKATEMGGLISGEHGIGSGKMEYLSDFVGPVNMRLMRGIKEVFDPNMILNPGKVCYAIEA